MIFTRILNSCERDGANEQFHKFTNQDSTVTPQVSQSLSKFHSGKESTFREKSRARNGKKYLTLAPIFCIVTLHLFHYKLSYLSLIFWQRGGNQQTLWKTLKNGVTFDTKITDCFWPITLFCKAILALCKQGGNFHRHLIVWLLLTRRMFACLSSNLLSPIFCVSTHKFSFPKGEAWKNRS